MHNLCGKFWLSFDKGLCTIYVAGFDKRLCTTYVAGFGLVLTRDCTTYMAGFGLVLMRDYAQLTWQVLASFWRGTVPAQPAPAFFSGCWSRWFVGVFVIATHWNHNSKIHKYLHTQKFCCNQPKIWTRLLCHKVMRHKDADGMANSVDPDQTAPLHCLPRPSCLKI